MKHWKRDRYIYIQSYAQHIFLVCPIGKTENKQPKQAMMSRVFHGSVKNREKTGCPLNTFLTPRASPRCLGSQRWGFHFLKKKHFFSPCENNGTGSKSLDPSDKSDLLDKSAGAWDCRRERETWRRAAWRGVMWVIGVWERVRALQRGSVIWLSMNNGFALGNS